MDTEVATVPLVPITPSKAKKTAGQLKRERIAAKLAKNSDSSKSSNEIKSVKSAKSSIPSTPSAIVKQIKQNLELKRQLEEKARLEELARKEAERVTEEKRKKEVEERETKRLKRIETREKMRRELKSQGKYVAPARKARDKLAAERIELMKSGKSSIKSADAVADVSRELDTKETKEIKREPTVGLTLICSCVGHIDVGKTKMIDRLQGSDIQSKEAGGITQKISASYVSKNQLMKYQYSFQDKDQLDQLEGLILIDLPGHELFSNLRKRGSGLSNITILVIDLLHGLQEQTLASIEMLKESKTPFIIALNKIDRLYGWESRDSKNSKNSKDSNFNFSLNEQTEEVQMRFKYKCAEVLTELAKQGLNGILYSEYEYNRTTTSFSIIPMVPISALTGEGIPELLHTLTVVAKQHDDSEIFRAKILEIKMIEGLGNVADVVITNGTLACGDKIIMPGFDGPIITTVKTLIVPDIANGANRPNVSIDKVTGPMIAQICASNLVDCIPGTSVHLVHYHTDCSDKLKDSVQSEIQPLLAMGAMGARFKSATKGFWVQANSLGSMESLAKYMGDCELPILDIGIGQLQKKHVTTTSTMEYPYKTILAFDVKITSDIQKYADDNDVKIYSSDVIYRLVDMAKDHMSEYNKKIFDENAKIAIFPCILQILKENVYNKKSPIILGVRVIDGVLKLGTPLCTLCHQSDQSRPSGQSKLVIGIVTSIRNNDEELTTAEKGSEICIKIDATASAIPSICYGRHFDYSNKLISILSRESIDKLKESFKNVLTKEQWMLVVKLKPLFGL